MAAHTPSSKNRPSREQQLTNQIRNFKHLLKSAQEILTEDEQAVRDAELHAAQALQIEILQVTAQGNQVLADIRQAQYERLRDYQRGTEMYRKWWWPILLILASLFGSLLPGLAMADLRDEQRRRDMLDEHKRKLHTTHQRLLHRFNYLQSRKHNPETKEVKEARERLALSRREVSSLRWQIRRLEVELDSLQP